MKEASKKFGFDNESEMHKMISNVDISTSEKYSAFKKWQRDDGTKEGLNSLIRSKIC